MPVHPLSLILYREHCSHTNELATAIVATSSQHTQPDAGERARCLDDLMKDNCGTLEPLALIQEVAPLYYTGDSQVVVYEFNNNHVYVSYASPSGGGQQRSASGRGELGNVTKAVDQPSTRFNMAALFAHQL